jgi:hypothetical protein
MYYCLYALLRAADIFSSRAQLYSYVPTGCASGPGGERNIFGNKYGQYLAAIQVAREDRLAAKQARHQKEAEEDEEGEEDFGPSRSSGKLADGRNSESGDDNEQENDSDEDAVVGAADGSSGKKSSIWAADVAEEANVHLDESIMGQLSADAEKEGRGGLKNFGGKDTGRGDDAGFERPSSKRTKHGH